MLIRSLVLAVVIVTALSESGFADTKAQDLDYVALSARLVQDGHYQRASQTLELVDEADEELDRKLYFVLKGLIALHKKLYVASGESFDAAIAAGNTKPLVYINLGRARYGAKDYQGTISALTLAGKAALSEPQAELLLCQAYWELGESGKALNVVARAGKRFPSAIVFARVEMTYLLKLGLYQELASRRSKFLVRADVQAEDFVAIGEALRQSGRLKEAVISLEVARMRFPEHIGLTVELARIFMDAGKLLSSAMLLEQAARHDQKYLIESAEMYRRSGRLVRSLLINKRVPNQKKKMRQRLQILLELQRYEMIAGMENRLSRLGLLDDQQIRYALAYGFFQIRDFESAADHIRHLSNSSFFEKGIALRKAIRACREAAWLCQ